MCLVPLSLCLEKELDRESHRPWTAETVERRKTATHQTAPAHRRRLPEEGRSHDKIVPDRILEVRMIENIERVSLDL